MLFRAIYLACFINKDNKITYDKCKSKAIYKKKDLREIFKVKEALFNKICKYLINKEIMFVNENKEIVINKKFAKKSKTDVKDSILVNMDYIKDVYDKIKITEHKIFGRIFNVINNINNNIIYYNDKPCYFKNNLLNIMNCDKNTYDRIIIRMKKYNIDIFGTITINKRECYGINPMIYCDSYQKYDYDEEWEEFKESFNYD